MADLICYGAAQPSGVSSHHVIRNSSQSVQSGESLVPLIVASKLYKNRSKGSVESLKWTLIGQAGFTTLITVDKCAPPNVPLTSGDMIQPELDRMILPVYPMRQYRFECPEVPGVFAKSLRGMVSPASRRACLGWLALVILDSSWSLGMVMALDSCAG